MLLRKIDSLDELLNAYAAQLGRDFTSYRNHLYRDVNFCVAFWLVEPFRRADWVDVSRGLIRFGLPRSFLREVFATWPAAGFHKKLVQLELGRLRTHPWNPLPMVKL